jgi:putative transposase
VFIERLWRTVKYEDEYLREYRNGKDLHERLTRYFQHSTERPRSALQSQTPRDVHSRRLHL